MNSSTKVNEISLRTLSTADNENTIRWLPVESLIKFQHYGKLVIG